MHRRAQVQQPDDPHHERQPLELGEVFDGEVAHADVVVEEVDLLEVLPAVAPDERVAVDVEAQALGVLRREHGQVPEREEVDRREEQRGGHQQQPRAEVERGVEDPVEPNEEGVHGRGHPTRGRQRAVERAARGRPAAAAPTSAGYRTIM